MDEWIRNRENNNLVGFMQPVKSIRARILTTPPVSLTDAPRPPWPWDRGAWIWKFALS